MAPKKLDAYSRNPSSTNRVLSRRAQTLNIALYSDTVQQRKSLICKLMKEPRVMSRDEIIPTYRVPGLVRAPGSQVERIGIEPTTSCLQSRCSTN
jgi:hypothetical protein